MQRKTEIVLRYSPVERNAIAWNFPKQPLVENDGILKCVIDAPILTVLIKRLPIRSAV
jgi:hypothetical protein